MVTAEVKDFTRRQQKNSGEQVSFRIHHLRLPMQNVVSITADDFSTDSGSREASLRFRAKWTQGVLPGHPPQAMNYPA